MKKIGGMGISLIVILVVFTIGYFVVANKISYDFTTDYEKDLYDLKLNTIAKNAKIYGENNADLFAEAEDAYITVADLAKQEFIINNEGIVVDPRDEEKNLNDLKIKLTKKDDEVTAKVLV